jgi:hypothetical protein
MGSRPLPRVDFVSLLIFYTSPFLSSIIMPTYSEDTLIAALAAYRNGEYTSDPKEYLRV